MVALMAKKALPDSSLTLPAHVGGKFCKELTVTSGLCSDWRVGSFPSPCGALLLNGCHQLCVFSSTCIPWTDQLCTKEKRWQEKYFRAPVNPGRSSLCDFHASESAGWSVLHPNSPSRWLTKCYLSISHAVTQAVLSLCLTVHAFVSAQKPFWLSSPQ